MYKPMFLNPRKLGSMMSFQINIGGFLPVAISGIAPGNRHQLQRGQGMDKSWPRLLAFHVSQPCIVKTSSLRSQNEQIQ